MKTRGSEYDTPMTPRQTGWFLVLVALFLMALILATGHPAIQEPLSALFTAP